MSYIGNTPTTQAFIPAIDYFSGNGSTTAFTLSRPVASVAQVQAVVENVPQKPGDAFSVSGNVITFTSAPPSGTNNIYVYYTSPITQVIAPGQGTVGTAALAPNIALSGQSLTVAGNNISAVNSLGFRNRIINGDMRIDQRNGGASVNSSGGGTFSVDRFTSFASGGGVYTTQRSTDVPTGQGFVNSIVSTVTTTDSPTGSDYYLLTQTIEGFNIADLGWGTANARSVTISFWVKASITGTYTVAFRNSALNRSYRATYTINAANTWEYKTVTVAGDTTGTWLTDNGAGIRVGFTLGAGSDFIDTGNVWSALEDFAATGQTQWISTNGATFYITGVQLEAGSVATPFERRPYGTELALCQRYFAKTFPQTTAVAQNTNESGALDLPINPTAGTAGLLWTQWVFPVIMRTSPTITLYNPSAANSNWRNSANSGDLTASTGQQSDRVVQVRAANVPTGQGAYIHLTASAEL